MSATTLAPPESPVLFVQSLPPEARGEVFFALLQEIVAVHGGQGLIPIYTPAGEPFGHYVPPAAQQAQYEAALAAMPEDVRKKMTAPLPDDFDSNDVVTEAELATVKGQAYQSLR